MSRRFLILSGAIFAFLADCTIIILAVVLVNTIDIDGYLSVMLNIVCAIVFTLALLCLIRAATSPNLTEKSEHVQALTNSEIKLLQQYRKMNKPMRKDAIEILKLLNKGYLISDIENYYGKEAER